MFLTSTWVLTCVERQTIAKLLAIGGHGVRVLDVLTVLQVHMTEGTFVNRDRLKPQLLHSFLYYDSLPITALEWPLYRYASANFRTASHDANQGSPNGVPKMFVCSNSILGDRRIGL